MPVRAREVYSPRKLAEQARWIWAHWRPYRRELPLLMFLTLANAAVLVIHPLFLERVVEGIEQSLGRGVIIRNVALMAAFGVLHFGIYLLLQGSRARLNLRFDYGVRFRAFENLLRMGPGFFSRFRTGDIVTRLTDDVSDKLSWYMCSGLLRTIEASTLIVFGVFMMLRISPTLTLYAAGPLPVLIGVFILTATRLQRRYQTVQELISALNARLENAFGGIRVVKAFAAEDLQRALVEGAIEEQRRAEIRSVRWQTVIDSLYGHIWQFAIVGVLLAGGSMAMKGEITLGQLVAFDAYVLLLVWPMFDVGQFLVRGRLSAVSIERIAALEDTPPEVAESDDWIPQPRRPDDPPLDPAGLPVPSHGSSGARTPPPGGGLAVAFENVDFTWSDSGSPTLRDLSFIAEPGTLTAVAGEIGSGKSTALALIPRLMDAGKGCVLVGGLDTRDWAPTELRERIGYVSQEAVLFSTTLGENVRFGRPTVDEAAIDRAVSAAGLGAEIADWPEGLDTMVGARGVRLSGGQKQRAALARALVTRPDVLLLDDCTASLDAGKEDEIWRAVFETVPGCTTIIVTHRPATLERADRIVVLDAGRAVASGTFAELNQPGTRFHELYTRWKLEGELDEGDPPPVS